MKRKENIIDYDFQGWPEYKMTLREILESLGLSLEVRADVEEGYFISSKNPMLDKYPVIFHDDGMGYSPTIEYITDVDKEELAFWVNQQNNDKDGNKKFE